MYGRHEGDVVDPVLEAAATALATKAADTVVEGVRSAWSALVRLVCTRFAGDPTAQTALDAASAEPTDTEKIEALTDELARAERADPEFGQQLRRLWEQAAMEVRAESGGVVNQISGSVGGHAVQARDIAGGVSFGQPPSPDGGH
jgi:hypothetical protein